MKAVLFDACGVLYNRADAHKRLYDFLRRQRLPAPPWKTVLASVEGVRDKAFRGVVSRDTFFDAALRAYGVTDAALLAEGRQAQAEDAADILLYPAVPETLTALHARGFKLGVVTDTAAETAEKRRWLRAQGLDIAWDAFANSREVGLRKPRPEMYRAALAQCGVAPTDAVFVGHKASELDGARTVGLGTVAVYADANAQADAHIAAFADLLTLPVLRTVE